MKPILIALVAAAVSGCARVPDVTYRYYPTKWQTLATITQTVGCNANGTQLVVRNLPSVATSYTSDLEGTPLQLRIKSLEGWVGPFADSDVTMTLTDDGRLKSINQSTTGQGEAIVKAVVTLIATMGILTKPLPIPLPECKVIEKWGEGKPVSLIYTTTINSSALGSTVAFLPARESSELHDLIVRVLPKLSAKVATGAPVQAPASFEPGWWETAVLVELQRTAYADVLFEAEGGMAPVGQIGKARIVFPMECAGDACRYKLPIPRAALFGTQKFQLVVGESGAVTSIGYTKTSGTAGAVNAVNAALSSETATAKAAELKAQADLIAQEQRLVLCQTRPAECK